MPGPQIIAEPADHQTDPLEVRALRLKLIQRRRQVRPPLTRMQVLRRGAGQSVAPHDPFGREDELSGPRYQTDPLQPVFQPGHRPARPAEHLEPQLRHPVAIGPQRQVLEHHIGRAPIGRSAPLHRLDQWIRRLSGPAPVQPHRHTRQIHRLPVRPDPANPVDLALAQGHGEAQRIVVFHRPRSALAGRGRPAPLEEARGPDHLTGHPRPPEHTGHGRALRRALHPQRFQPRPPLSRGLQTGNHPLIDDPSEARPDDGPDRASDRLADRAQNHLRHGQASPTGSTPGRRKAATSLRRHHEPIQLSTTDRPQ